MLLENFKEKKEEFLVYLTIEKNLADNTHRAYEGDLNQFISFWESLPEQDKKHLEVRQIIERFLDFCMRIWCTFIFNSRRLAGRLSASLFFSFSVSSSKFLNVSVFIACRANPSIKLLNSGSAKVINEGMLRLGFFKALSNARENVSS